MYRWGLRNTREKGKNVYRKLKICRKLPKPDPEGQKNQHEKELSENMTL